MTIKKVSDLAWFNAANTIITARVEFEDGRVWPMCVHANYDTDEGRELWDGAMAGAFGPIIGYVEPAEPTPEERRALMPNLTARQLRLGLHHLGKLAGVPLAIAALPEPQKTEAQIEWDFASEFRRLHPLIVQLIPILGLTEEQVDPVWEQFAQV